MLDQEDCVQVGGAGWMPVVEQTARYAEYLEAKEFHKPRVKHLIVATLAGHIGFCPGMLRGKFERKMTAGDLWEAITIGADPAMLAKLLASPIDADARSESWVWAADLIDAYASDTADALAKEEAGL